MNRQLADDVRRVLFQANMQAQIDRAMATVIHDKRAPDVVAKADADLARQIREAEGEADPD